MSSSYTGSGVKVSQIFEDTTTEMNMAIRNTQLIIYAFNFKLINHFENIVFGRVEINKFNVEVFLRSKMCIRDSVPSVSSHDKNKLSQYA